MTLHSLTILMEEICCRQKIIHNKYIEIWTSDKVVAPVQMTTIKLLSAANQHIKQPYCRHSISASWCQIPLYWVALIIVNFW